MAQFTVTVNAQVNLPPNQIGNKNINKEFNQDHMFTIDDFTTTTVPTYQDPEGDPASLVKIITVPLQGDLLLDGIAVINGQNIDVADINLGLLVYDVDEAITAGYGVNLTFDIADAGSGSFSGLTGVIGITMAAQVNLPPSQVGDNSLSTDYGVTIVFTVDDFTTDTTPPYADPEGDAAECLQVLSLPAEGTLQLNGADVVLNQEILFSDIALGLFTFVPNNANTNTYNVSFDNQIKDAGSGTYSS